MSLRRPNFSGTFKRALLVGLLPAVGGCSLAFVHGPQPRGQSQETRSCTSSWILPVLDVVEVAIGVRGVLVADNDFFAKREEKVAVSAAWALLFGTSAAIGFKRVHECRSLERDLAREAEEGDGAPSTSAKTDAQPHDTTGPVDGIASPLGIPPWSPQR